MKRFFVILLVITSSFPIVYAQTIPITISSRMSNVIFDGKWSFMQEWKESSLTQIDSNSGPIYIRTAHWQNYVYVMIDAASITSFEKNSDRATVCFDKNDTKSSISNQNNYCFVSVLNGPTFVLQGGSHIALNGNFKKISPPPDFIGIGGISDENDRYTSIPHPIYEFKIPTELLGRSNHYGFYVSIYDTLENKIYSWPLGISNDSPLMIPSPQTWGKIVSPDSSLPEFPYPVFALIISLALILYLTRINKIKFRY